MDPFDLKSRLRDRKVVPIVGSGVSISTAGVPSWSSLITKAIDFGRSHHAESDDLDIAKLALDKRRYALAAESVQISLTNAGVFSQFLRSTFDNLPIKSRALIQSIAALNPPFIATTNYDRLLETVIGNGTPTETWQDAESLLDMFRHFGILHLHGVYTKPKTVILGAGDYARLGEQAAYAAFMRALWTGYTLLFVGCSLDGVQDPDFSSLFQWAKATFGTPAFPHYMLLPSSEYTPERARELRKLGVEVVDIGFDITRLADWIAENLIDIQVKTDSFVLHLNTLVYEGDIKLSPDPVSMQPAEIIAQKSKGARIAAPPRRPAASVQSLSVFLSHGKEDKPAVLKLYNDLVFAGVKPWLDAKDLVAGQHWRKTTIKAVRECDIVIVCLTQSSISRDGFLQKEIAEALDVADEKPEGSIFIIPLRLEECDVPDRLREWHWVDYFTSGGHQSLQTALSVRAKELGRKRLRFVTVLPSPVPENNTSKSQPELPAMTEPQENQTEIQQLAKRIPDPTLPISYWLNSSDRLSELGDSRPGVGLRSDGLPDIVWCDVLSGPFIFGGDRQAYNSGQSETIDLYTFRISKYPVTYSQFQSFIGDPDGYSNSRWWASLNEKGHEQQRGGPGDQAFKYSNHPRERVSWYDAMAFCAWLTAKLGMPVTLPTEHQWEKAARGPNGLYYPYGNLFDALKSNTLEAGIGQTSTVGIFSDGMSPYDVADMSGNVWEWTLTKYESCTDTNVSSGTRCVLRGGSWFSGQDLARAASRNHYHPDVRFSRVGFRLASPTDLL